MANNSMVTLISYFQSDYKSVTLEEFQQFWNSLSFEEKMYFVTVDLQTGLMPTE